jgi:hypothetical protein
MQWKHGSFLPAALVAVAILSAVPTLASGGILDTTPHALAGWQGKNDHINPGMPPFIPALDADVEWAVFAPGSFQLMLDEEGIPFVDPNPASYTYAYQVINWASTNAVDFFTVGVDAEDPLDGAAPNFVPALLSGGTVDPGDMGYNGGTHGGPNSGVDGSVKWDFIAALGVGQSTGILFFSSPQGPQWDSSVVTSGLSADSQDVGSPVPEPLTLTILAGGGLSLVLHRRRR